MKKIKEISNQSELITSVVVLRESFGTVAKEFNLTIKNCPTNAAFISLDKLKMMKEDGILMFGLFLGNKQIGFVALEKVNNNLYYLEKLAVLPGYRHQEYGKELMDFCFEYAKEKKIKKVTIAIINEHEKLKNWYIKYGFTIMNTKKFEHLPFTVCFMGKEVS